MRFEGRGRCLAPLSFVLSGVLLLCSAATARKIQPVSVTFGDDFLGYDGKWSTVQVAVGSAEDAISVIPNTVSAESWVIGPGGCDGSLQCLRDRGGLFFQNQSYTWTELGHFDLGDDLISNALVGEYGLDSIRISNSVLAQRQTIGVVNDVAVWLGTLGLGVGQTQFNTKGDYASLLSYLVHNESAIPSHSYGYTAGAYYAERSMPGSLTLGGVDESRFISFGVPFVLDNSYKPVMTVHSIDVKAAPSADTLPSTWVTNPYNLMQPQEAATFTIDSSTPFLWMPQEVCNRFAAALNLTYNSTLNLYTFQDGTSPTTLANWNLTFTFVLAESLSSPNKISIPITYHAFDLQLSWPFPGLSDTPGVPINYFPLRPANSSSQYVIGRAFLQETYLTVDYERGSFSVSPAIITTLNSPSPRIVAITRPSGSLWPAPSLNDKSLSTGAKAGIGVAVALVVVGIILLALLWRSRLRRKQPIRDKPETAEYGGIRGFFSSLKKKGKKLKSMVPELAGDKRQPKEMLADASNTRFELPSNNPVEMSAGDVPPVFLQAHQDDGDAIVPRRDPDHPAELGQRRGSTEKVVVTTTTAVSERSSSPVPPYSPTDLDRSHSDSVSPNSLRTSNPFAGSQSSGEPSVSPITPYPHPLLVPLSYQEMSRSGLTTTSISNPQPSNNPPEGSHDRTSTQSSRLTLQQQALLRSVSRNSRFREELNDESPPRTVDDGPEKRIRQRFSWEE